MDGDQALRHGLVRLLAQDPRLRLLDPVADLAELRTAGLQYDACVLGLPETGFSDTVTEFMRAVPCVVWIPALGIPTLGEQADGWRHWVASWVQGARGVVGHDVARVAFADAVLSAARSPHDLHPHIARALLEATSATDLGVSATLAGTLGEVAKGRRTAAAMSASGTSAATHALDLAHLRDACERAGLGVPRRSGDGRRRHDRGDAFEPGVIPPEALMLSSRVREVLRCYADGYDYEEIAQHLNISETTVKSHVLSAMDIRYHAQPLVRGPATVRDLHLGASQPAGPPAAPPRPNPEQHPGGLRPSPGRIAVGRTQREFTPLRDEIRQATTAF
ncbi:LuxR C-terminal-related transcriptional regulator [Streptomyces parvus]